jgi:hypothetical protein
MYVGTLHWDETNFGILDKSADFGALAIGRASHSPLRRVPFAKPKREIRFSNLMAFPSHHASAAIPQARDGGSDFPPESIMPEAGAGCRAGLDRGELPGGAALLSNGVAFRAFSENTLILKGLSASFCKIGVF